MRILGIAAGTSRKSGESSGLVPSVLGLAERPCIEIKYERQMIWYLKLQRSYE
jgi:hypothetical protein